ncbi:diguanylate cyclase [Chloroflexota bacterium]
MFWGKLEAPLVLASLFAHTLFIAAFTNKGFGKVAVLGSLYLAFTVVLVVMGYLPRGFILLDSGIIYKDYGLSLYVLNLGSIAFMFTAAFLLVRSYQDSSNPGHINRIAYLLLGIISMIGFSILWKVLPGQSYAVDHIGHMGNTLIMTYAIFRHRPLDMKMVVKKGLIYTGILFFIGASSLLLINGLNYFLQIWPARAGIVATLGMLIALAFMFSPLKTVLEKSADRLFYGKAYDYRQVLLNFSSRMSSVIELEELAEAMLSSVAHAVRASQASLLFSGNGHFRAQFAERLVKGDPVIPVSFRKDSPIVDWLTRENRPLSGEILNMDVEFKGLWQEERDNLEAAQIELLCPIKCKQKLVAILALGRKHRRGYYSSDDADMLMTLAHEAAVAIENADLHQRAEKRANTDELTGLFNHRYFHQRLSEEIARSSRFGDVFSLVFLDLDLFKTYNDVSGHPSGDKILKIIGQHIQESVKETDVCFRYGGDEFAIILPGVQADDGRRLAERIRKGVEARMDLPGVPLTCSIGLASWPNDGVMREEIIRAADAALYYAKQTGKNRTCMASEVVLSEALRVESGLNQTSSKVVLSTIYALAATVDAKDHSTYGHSKKVSEYAMDIAEALDYSREGIDRIRAAALLHDIGKIGISDRLLKKSGALTPDEWKLVHTHPDLGVAIIKHIDSLSDCLDAVQYHHEHFDGNGYPAGLKGDNIPLDARIMAIADAYDAMTSPRAYRKIMTKEQALDELQRRAGMQFDPVIVDVFIRLNKEPSKASLESNLNRPPVKQP